MSPLRRQPLAASGGPAAMPAARPRAARPFQASPGNSPGPWDYVTVATTTAEDTVRPMQEGGCPLVRG